MVESREKLIDRYMDALDEDDFELLRPHLADDVKYTSLVGDFEGLEEVERFYETERNASDTVHEIDRYVHTDEVSFAEGHTWGQLPDTGRFEANFCIGFEFADDNITHISVYVRRR
ncbi:nuclear transport factor 2 family protein [Natrarchaeobius chitinivorans]|uniref:Nuclear transport factor 2 family protein n=1 Tax=Natrarchaeobius chitinivorans TaxID=1679083 RepID=A0A3N6LV09_NATCH|nr:nuclear transport factor 2 family protein [Natrarchaeobius chitinivorans]RQG94188.1 nuclear transport factor 2 family protein [Natrarchaeobius chitinivorans]